jgi:hypothetical protein
VRLLVAALLVAGSLSGCRGGDAYCDAVQDHQAELTDVTASGTPGALLEALPVFRDLQERAPDDIRDDWQAFLDPLEQLDDALRDAGIDPAAYDATALPESLGAEERTRIEDAAAGILAPAVVRAFDSVQQQAKDVCHTPMSL